MNPAKRKKLYRASLQQDTKPSSEPVVVVQDVKKELDLGLKQMPAADTQVAKQEVVSMPVAVSVAQASLSVEQPVIVATAVAESVVVEPVVAETTLSDSEQVISHPVMEVKKKKKV